MYNKKVEFSELLGKIIIDISGLEKDGLEVVFTCSDGKEYKMEHYQDCCESVWIEDIAGNVSDLIGYPITMAEEESNSDNPPLNEYDESYTWTYYKLATIKGYVTIRWYGESNGYYSESVDFEEVL
jgi:hypothetical protein